jgi:hypothetical protein
MNTAKQGLNLFMRSKNVRKTIFEQEIQQILKEWERYQPRRRWPGGGPLPSLGKLQLRRYIEDYIKEHRCLPEGDHCIPAGKDICEKHNGSFWVYFPKRSYQKFHTHLEKALRSLILEHDFGDDPIKAKSGIKKRLESLVNSWEIDRIIEKVIPQENNYED